MHVSIKHIIVLNVDNHQDHLIKTACKGVNEVIERERMIPSNNYLERLGIALEQQDALSDHSRMQQFQKVECGLRPLFW